METRLKKIFNRQGRLLPDTRGSSDATFHTGHQPSSPSNATRPTFSHQPRTNSNEEFSKRPDGHAPFLRSFSYDAVSAGKAPTIGTLPRKGNGPVKLQTSRRLSSGELIATTQDHCRTLQDIREGEYIVGKKERPSSRAPVTTSTTPQLNTGTSLLTPTKSHLSIDTPVSQTWSEPPRSINPDMVSGREGTHQPIAHHNTGLGLSSPSINSQYGQSYHFLESPGSDSPAFRPDISTPRPNLHPRSRESATLEALRRAEYGRLVEVYGEEMTLQQVAQMEGRYYEPQSTSSSPQHQQPSSFALEPLPSPYLDEFDVKQRRGSDTSGIDSFCEGKSGQSSLHRASNVSSHDDASTATAQTSLAEEEIENTADDIRKLVAQLRTSYLTALDARPLPPPLPKSQRKRRKMKSLSSPAVRSGESFTPKSTPPLVQGHGRQTWHTQDHYFTSNPHKRLHSAPFPPANRLSTIRASSPDNDDSTGIRRADSTTLGGLMAEVTRSKIQNETALFLANGSSEVNMNNPDIIPNVQTSDRINPEVSLQGNQSNKLHTFWLNQQSDPINENLLDSPMEDSNLEVEERESNHNVRFSVHRFPSLALSRAERSAETRLSSLGHAYQTGKGRGRHHRHHSCTAAIEISDHKFSDTYSNMQPPSTNNVALVGIPKPAGNFF